MVTLVALLASDEQDGRRVACDLWQVDEIRTDSGDVHVRDAALAVPGRLPLRERDDRVVAAVPCDVAHAGAGERLARMHERRLDERDAFFPRRARERAGPLARDGMHDVRAGDGAAELLVADERRGQERVDRGADPTEAHGKQPEVRCRRHARAAPRGLESYERDVVATRPELAVE